mmetsp:Transcript_39322/g.57854  ORF Transcript_39322/g.57854 Transcript_39322/m.57854 type:complete len:327 (+) Transcript_39322:187-1167(+)|eukprot:CAMPEP_0195525360 /NCGR_PEP_ID=MMETSP0794_2-20130614/25782_1 /TAXON_ID=515487 /ORGANISM="Stephanopyxis turris, Strain CCMP 815" /LENGTH=326 /DNA_ID=CAMNT_0040655815 /DNA_START=185 /DNA_END=1168 /DNA_ORIENTATION=+
MHAAIRSGLLGWTLSFRQDIPKPKFDPSKSPRDVLLDVQSAAINPIDYKLPRLVGGTIFGLDVSGTVQAIGSEVTEFSVGDQVFGTASTGSLAQYAVAKVDRIAKKPDFLSFREAAALPIAYVTGLQALRDAGKIGNQFKEETGGSVLVIGASGGCGIAGVQLAKALGVKRIVGVCSAKNADFVREAGASEVVDYNEQDGMEDFFSKNRGKFDCVYDTATGSGKKEDYTDRSIPLLTEAGEYVQINGGPSVWAKKMMGGKSERRTLVLTDINRSNLEAVSSLLEGSGARPHVNEMPFTEKGVNDGFDLLKSRRTKGKIVFDVGSVS